MNAFFDTISWVISVMRTEFDLDPWLGSKTATDYGSNRRLFSGAIMDETDECYCMLVIIAGYEQRDLSKA
jgi:hypothetical protein